MKKLLVAFLLLLLLLLLIFLSSRPPVYKPISEREMEQIENVRRQAYDYAVSCSKTENPALSYEEITWMINPGNVLRIKATDGTINLKGWFDQQNNTIWVPYTERRTFWILAHESLHAIGYIGHPYVPFYEPCKLMAEQN